MLFTVEAVRVHMVDALVDLVRMATASDMIDIAGRPIAALSDRRQCQKAKR